MASTMKYDIYIAPVIPMTTSPPLPPNLSWSPISSTLIQTEKSAVLVDTAITVEQNTALADWVSLKLSPGVELTHIYITHGHGDHFFGVPLLQNRFPGVKFIATQGTLEHVKQQYEPANYDGIWNKFFPGQIAEGKPIPEALPENGRFEVDGHAFQAVEVGHTDTFDTTVLHVPELKLVVGGDVVYGDCYQHFGEAKTPEKRAEWLRALDKVSELGAEVAVAGHMKEEQVGRDSAEVLIGNTKKYIQDFEEEKSKANNGQDLFMSMKKKYPDRLNDFILMLGSNAAFAV
jgi:glyoxylase-like metal-dependent hydrolase (beta-lactamase superfamily II)